MDIAPVIRRLGVPLVIAVVALLSTATAASATSPNASWNYRVEAASAFAGFNIVQCSDASGACGAFNNSSTVFYYRLTYPTTTSVGTSPAAGNKWIVSRAYCNGSAISSGTGWNFGPNATGATVTMGKNRSDCAGDLEMAMEWGVATAAGSPSASDVLNNVYPTLWGKRITFRYNGALSAPPAPVTAGACVLTLNQLAMVARGAGFVDSNGPTAVAVAIAESSARVGALHYNSSSATYDIGLWQINDGTWPAYDRDRLRAEPTYNAVAAQAIWDVGDTFTPWTTYNSGAYLAYMSKATAAWNSSKPSTIISSSCNGLTADPSGATVTDANDGNDSTGDNCGFSVNPIVWMKCLFVPSDEAMEGWTDHTNDIIAQPPVSLITGTVGYAGAYFNNLYCDDDADMVGPVFTGGGCTGTGNNQQLSAKFGCLDTSQTACGYEVEPLAKAGEMVQGNSATAVAYKLATYGLWIFFFFAAWNLVSGQFGDNTPTMAGGTDL